MREAVHRLDAVALLVDLGEVHVLAVVVVVPGAPPELLAQDPRPEDDLVAAREVLAPLELLDEVAQQRALGVPEHQAGADLVGEGEQVELLADLAVVALLRLLEPVQVGLERRLVGEAGAVDALEHPVLLVAAPVGAGDREQLEGLDLAGRGDVRPAAEVGEAALAVDRDGRVVDRLDQLDLVDLALVAEGAQRLVAGHLAAHERRVGLDDLGHALLDALEVLGREGLLDVEVVVEALLDRGADRELGAREEVGDRLGQDVGARVAEDVAPLGAVEAHALDAAVGGQRRGQVGEAAVDPGGDEAARGPGAPAARPWSALPAAVPAGNSAVVPSGKETVMVDMSSGRSAGGG